ncbi:glycosyltransferase family 2 protein [Brasilonema octagenarum]|uniref:Glycosyltransferase family 2 protein n=1 Tax=Brasilonema octagenarum UFV-OR1 TaxID=417115 RepID=A0ABX1M8D1_9CYAN|nr:glycosyltransferase family 2 protein [Brasilonema octagenarum]NMF64819.1 glycosyltransferase family 2 protein [Brasilonema octagenarum UFV-OR1]
MSQVNSSQEPLVSVIIPTYDRPEYLKQAINSAVKQTYRNIEIIVSDNCSPISPQKIVESFGDSRIQCSSQLSNVGMFVNQMDTFKKAQGKYVASLHDDDMWNEDFLEKLVPALENNPDIILAFCDQYIIDKHGKIDHIGTEENSTAYKRTILKKGVHQPFLEIAVIDKSVPIAAACVIRKEFVDWEKIPQEVDGMWDLYLAYLCSRSGHGAYYYPEKLTRYRAHEQTDTNLSGSLDAKANLSGSLDAHTKAKIRKGRAEIFCYEQFMKDEKLKKYKLYFKQKWLESHTTLAIGLLRSEQTTEARPYLLRALSEQKFNFRTIAALILSFIPRPITNQLLGVAAK